MSMLIYSLVALLLFLIGIDTYLTLRIYEKYGPEAEENLILRQILRNNPRNFVIFKFFDGVFLGMVFHFLAIHNFKVALALLLLSISVYFYVVHNNFQVLKG